MKIRITRRTVLYGAGSVWEQAKPRHERGPKLKEAKAMAKPGAAKTTAWE